MTVTRIITSGAYVGSELEAEFGRIPPCFLPVGGGLLIHRQLAQLSAPDVDLVLTLPADFILSDLAAQRIADQGCRVLGIDPSVSLGRSIAHALATLAPTGAVEIVHGDTLIAVPAGIGGDAMSVGAAGDGYHWASADIEAGSIARIHDNGFDAEASPRPILTGYFRFSDADALLRALVRADYRFIAALNDYVADHPCAPLQIDGWLDFGHLQTYFRSRHHLAAARHFNELRIADGVVHKSSSQSFKLSAEAHWLRSLPAPLQLYAARLIEDQAVEGAYATEYAFVPTLAEIYLSRLGATGWSRILDAVGTFLDAEAATAQGTTTALADLAVGKTLQRIERAPEAYPDIDRELTINGSAVPTGRRIVEHLAAIIAAAPPQPSTIMHGDLCFSNILYNSRNQRITVIDPRGYTQDGVIDPRGDLRYDIAKFGHSVIGRYDQILAGNVEFARHGDALTLTHEDNARHNWLEDAYRERSFAGIAAARADVMATMITLFISMIPLHSDAPARQRAFYANALALYARFFG